MKCEEGDTSLGFFMDNNLSPNMARGMKEFGENVEHLQENFPEEAKDIEWLPYVGERGLIVVTKDRNILRQPIQRKAFRENSVGAFFLGGKGLNRCQLIQQLVRNWPRMKELARKSHRPFAFKVPPKGSKIESIPLT